MLNLIYLASTQLLLLLHLYLKLPPTLKQLYFESLPERMFELVLQSRRNEVRPVSFLSCVDSGLLVWLIKWIACLGKKFFQASVEHLCRSTVVSIYHSRFVCFRPSMTLLVNRRLSPLEFVRRILTA